MNILFLFDINIFMRFHVGRSNVDNWLIIIRNVAEFVQGQHDTMKTLNAIAKRSS